MDRSESEIERLVFNRFEESLTTSDLTLRKEDKWQTAFLIRYFDIVIYKGNNPLAIIEVKGRLDNKTY
jgi:hypothetical protein